jgi:hypothetical protein
MFWYRSASRNSQGYVSGWELFLALIIVAALCAAIGAPLWWSYKQEQKKYNARLTQAHQQWDAGIGRPSEVALVVAGHDPVTVPHTMAQVNQYWYACFYKTCHHYGVYHYPHIVPVGVLTFTRGCYDVNPPNAVGQLMAALTPGGSTYVVALSADKKLLNICATTHQDVHDKLVYWSDQRGVPW